VAEPLRVVVVGGSLGGLTAALVLADMGCDVDVFERSPAPLDSRGAGIVLHPLTERYLVAVRGIPVERFATRASVLRYLDRHGHTLHESPVNYRFTAWNTLYRELLGAFPSERYHLGGTMTGITGATVELAGGGSETADLVVCADGLRSTARARLLPGVEPVYAGYLGWRGMLPESELSRRARDELGDAIVYHLAPAGHVLTYPIPGPNGSSAPGRRLVNFVWYRNLPETELARALVGADGTAREFSVPPGLVQPRLLEELRAAADALPPSIRELVRRAPEPFIQEIVDVEPPRMAFGRVCLLGDAAFVARPHAAAGTAKAAADAWALRDALLAHPDLDSALAAWERRQLAVGRALLDRVRAMGESSQFGAGWRAGDPSLRFGLLRPGDSEEEVR
jgi:2,6-dihydroxypyridine 3-monooxygenase